MAGSLPSSSSNFHLNWAIGAWHGRRLARHCCRQATPAHHWLGCIETCLQVILETLKWLANKWNASTHLAGSLNRALRGSREKTSCSQTIQVCIRCCIVSLLLAVTPIVTWQFEQQRRTWCFWFLPPSSFFLVTLVFWIRAAVLFFLLCSALKNQNFGTKKPFSCHCPSRIHITTFLKLLDRFTVNSTPPLFLLLAGDLRHQFPSLS